MSQADAIRDGFYRLVKWEEDQNPVFPSQETVVEVRAGFIINLSTGRKCQLNALGSERSLFGPLKSPYDIRPLDKLEQIRLGDVAQAVPSPK